MSNNCTNNLGFELKSSYKPYKPTVSRRQLKKLTLITDKNLGKVKGDLNRFVSKPCVILRGFRPKVLSIETVNFDGMLFRRKVYSKEEYPCYLPYLSGSCYTHQFWEDYLKDHLSFFRNINDIPRLAIGSDFEDTCIPISIGDRYKIYGNRLVIMHKWDKYVRNTPWLRFNELIQIPDGHDPETLLDYQIDSANRFISKDYEYLQEDLRYLDHHCCYLLNDLYDELITHVEDFVKQVLKSGSREVKSTVFQHDTHKIFFFINPAKFLQDGNSSEFFWFSDDTGRLHTDSAFSAIKEIYRDSIA